MNTGKGIIGEEDFTVATELKHSGMSRRIND